MLRIKPISSLYFDPLEPKRLRVVVATVVINVATVTLLTFAPWSDWRTALARIGGSVAIFLSYAIACGWTEGRFRH